MILFAVFLSCHNIYPLLIIHNPEMRRRKERRHDIQHSDIQHNVVQQNSK
jgi:hypothetical protein